jgi:hypothetical protein
MDLIVTNVYIFILAATFAILEIQIEGKDGWAKNLPTWRPSSKNFLVQLYSKIMSGKELTGYHLSVFFLAFLILNLPFAFGFPFTLENFLKIVSLYFIFCALWDFLWFILNPHYSLKKFKEEHLSFHHRKWFLGLPIDYFYGIAASFLVLIPLIINNGQILYWWMSSLALFIIQVLIVIAFTHYALKIESQKSPEKEVRHNQ